MFTAYTVTSAYNSDGRCVTTTQVSTLESAYSEILSSANGRVILDANGQKQFIDFLGFSTCSGGGENFSPTALVQVTNTTATESTTFTGLLAQQSVSLSITAVRSPSGLEHSHVMLTLMVLDSSLCNPSHHPKCDLPICRGARNRDREHNHHPNSQPHWSASLQWHDPLKLDGLPRPYRNHHPFHRRRKQYSEGECLAAGLGFRAGGLRRRRVLLVAYRGGISRFKSCIRDLHKYQL